MKRTLSLLIFSLFLNAAYSFDDIAIKGGTIIDVANWGKSAKDIKNAVILIRRSRIAEVGEINTITIPEGTRIIDASGKFIVPGLVDGFVALENQSFASAFLYMGVTSIIGVGGYRRGNLFESANPSPTIYKLGDAGRTETSTEDLLKQIERLSGQGVKVALLMYGIKPDQLKTAVEKAHELGIATIGELGLTSYARALETGINAFVHTGRYTLDAAPPELAKAVAADPWGSAKGQFNDYMTELQPTDKRLLTHAKKLGSGKVALIPTLSLFYLDLPGHRNPWKEPVANSINALDIHMPANPKTGNHEYNSEIARRAVQYAEALIRIEKVYKAAGARHLAGSGCDIRGTIPGISLHTELELLVRIGLTEREALAAATSSFADIFGWDELGELKPGRKADILVLNKNPLEDIENLKDISLLILNGKTIDRDALLKNVDTLK
jgi:hypothetical protein